MLKLEASGTVKQDSWELKLTVACYIWCITADGVRYVTFWWHRSPLLLKGNSPLSVQATKPSLVILADRKEWMMKTIGLGQE